MDRGKVRFCNVRPLSISRRETLDRKRRWFASDFFPKTIWEDVKSAEIAFEYREGNENKIGTVLENQVSVGAVIPIALSEASHILIFAAFNLLRRASAIQSL
jgi:hypothetical protein